MSDCLFCRIVAGEIPSARVYEDADAVAFLDIAPVKRGHTLVVSRTHVSDALADPGVLATLTPAIAAVGARLLERLGAEGLNVLSNVGEAAGQSVFHLHVHLIPRYADDAGFEALVRRTASPDLDTVLAELS